MKDGKPTERRSGEGEVMDQRDAQFEIPDEIRYELKKPFPRVAKAGETVKVLTFRPPNVGEMVKVSKVAEEDGDAASALRLMVLVNDDGLTEEDIKRVNYLDFQICVEKLQPFMQLSRRSAKKD